MSMENWRRVIDFERYEVSDLGRVRILSSGHIMATAKNRNGYVHLTLSTNGKKTTVDVHRLVAAAFLTASHGRDTVNHKNGNKSDNRANNIEYASRSENQRHALTVLGFQPRFGDRHPHVRLTDKQVECSRCLAKMGMAKAAIARKFKYSVGGMCDIINGKARTKAA